VVIHVTSNQKQESLSTNYYWISTTTKLPRARQTLSMNKRGKSLLPQSIITITNQNPQLTPATFAYKPTEKDSVAPPESNDDGKTGGSADRELTNLIGKQLPALTVDNTSFQKVKLVDIINKPTLITLWATWCMPCLKEMTFFQKLVDKHQGKFQVVAVSTSEQNTSAAVGFIKKHPEYKFTFLLDPDAEREISVMKKALGGIDGLPTNLLVDAKGKIVSAWLGERKESEWEELVDKLVTK
jgi:peroxiredoxin